MATNPIPAIKRQTKLSLHFWLHEFTRSSSAAKFGIENNPSDIQIVRLGLLCHLILEPIRERFDLPLQITSGFRNSELNSLVGGSSSSAHRCEGAQAEDEAACDFQIPSVPLQLIFDWIRLESHLPFDQVILERGQDQRHEYDDCIHISRRNNPRRIALVGSVRNQMPYQPAEVKA